MMEDTPGYREMMRMTHDDFLFSFILSQFFIGHRVLEAVAICRTQYVNIDGCHSTLSNVNLGVSLGCILGPVLFLIFINDLERSAADICG